MKCFSRIPRGMAFLAVETAPPCVLGRRVANSPARGPGSQNRRDLWGRDSGRHFGRGFYGASAVGLRMRAKCPPVPGPAARASVIRSARRRANRLAVQRTITLGFSSKRYRKGTSLVQVHSVSGWIRRSWTGAKASGLRQNPHHGLPQALGQVSIDFGFSEGRLPA
jgi:hypothetical protein